MRGYKHVSMSFVRAMDIHCYDPANPIHRQLAALSQQAHQATATENTTQVQEIEAEIDALAAGIWGLAEEELREIRESLEELA